MTIFGGTGRRSPGWRKKRVPKNEYFSNFFSKLDISQLPQKKIFWSIFGSKNVWASHPHPKKKSIFLEFFSKIGCFTTTIKNNFGKIFC